MNLVTEYITKINRIVAGGPYTEDWESFRGYSIPRWYQDGKFGIFIHWGVYSVPAFGNEWYPRNMYCQGTPEYHHHQAVYGSQKQFGYKDFIPYFTASNYDPAAWAALFKRAGARFVVPVAEHHDGFAMYASAFSRWTAAQMGPKRDLIGELAQAVRAEGMVFGLSSHRAEHWWFMNGGREFDSDVQDPAYQDFYGPATPMNGDAHRFDATPYPDPAYLDDWLARTCELVDRFQPQLVWFDWWIGHEAFKPYLPRFAAYYYNRAKEWGLEAAINYKYTAIPDHAAVLDIERGQLRDIRPFFWQNDTSVSKNSWGYIHSHEYKTSEMIIQDLVDIVSKNGALLLNIGPRPDGTIPEPEQELLEEIGGWLMINGEAIYGTRPWKIYGEGPTEVIEGSFTDTRRQAFTAEDFRFTTRGKTLYAICLGIPEKAKVCIKALSSSLPLFPAGIEEVTLLGSDQKIRWERTSEGLSIFLPEGAAKPPAFTFKIG
ncbi:MAG TPA: alpha-L-fucosidase [Anaerolineaceae bacterium]